MTQLSVSFFLNGSWNCFFFQLSLSWNLHLDISKVFFFVSINDRGIIKKTMKVIRENQRSRVECYMYTEEQCLAVRKICQHFLFVFGKRHQTEW